MLKIYNAYNENGRIILNDYLPFKDGGIYDSGLYGYGEVHSNNVTLKYANYDQTKLSAFLEYINNNTIEDGFTDEFIIWNPLTYKMLEEKEKKVERTEEEFEKFGLNEEAILLFADYVDLKYQNDELVKKILGRRTETGLYLLYPGAIITINPVMVSDEINNYEVLQSNSIGHNLVLKRFKRNIK